MIWDLARAPSADALNITVKGYQWWWGFEYPDLVTGFGDQKPVEIADDMVVPTGREIYLSLSSEGGGAKDVNGVPDFEVIHSFWVPELFGKQDVVPGRTNHILFSIDTPGTYTGQCAEFCGLQHGRMKLRVVALAPADWDAWVGTPHPGPIDPDGPARRGGGGDLPQSPRERRGLMYGVPQRRAMSVASRSQPLAFRRSHARVLRRVQLRYVPRRRFAEQGSARGLAPRIPAR